jgi:hypothetical protein
MDMCARRNRPTDIGRGFVIARNSGATLRSTCRLAMRVTPLEIPARWLTAVAKEGLVLDQDSGGGLAGDAHATVRHPSIRAGGPD